MSMNKPINGNPIDKAIYQKELTQKRIRYAENMIVTDKLLIQKLDVAITKMRLEKAQQVKLICYMTGF